MVSKLNLKLYRICIVTVNIIGNKKMPACTIKEAPGVLRAGKKGYLSSGSWGALFIILGELGNKDILLDI